MKSITYMWADIAAQFRGLNYKRIASVIVPFFALFATGIILVSLHSMPGHSSLFYVLLGLMSTFGLFLYLGGVALSVVAFQKAHHLFENPEDCCNGSAA